MRQITNYNTRKEQSSNNSTFTRPVTTKNKLLLRYLNSPDFERDFERARLEKGDR